MQKHLFDDFVLRLVLISCTVMGRFVIVVLFCFGLNREIVDLF